MAVVGAGSIGVSWAVVFARAGHQVVISDPDKGRCADAIDELRRRVQQLDDVGVLQESPEIVVDRVSVAANLEQAVIGAEYVQECAPENVELKRQLFADLDRIADPSVPIASSSSFMPASEFSADLDGRSRCLVAHPINPPHVIPLVEVVPAHFTSAETVERVVALLGAVGMTPVIVRGETEGFVFNRLQGALLREAYSLVREGVASVGDVDTTVREALAKRLVVAGPFENADLNTRGGIAQHAIRMGPAYARMGRRSAAEVEWTPDLVAEVERARRRELPLELWQARVEWRDRELLERAARSGGGSSSAPGAPLN